MDNLIKTVSGAKDGIRIRDYLKHHLGFSTSLIAKVKYGGVLLNGVAVHMRATVYDGDRVEILLPADNSDGITPLNIPLDVLYEDETVLAVCKPINMPVHPSRGNTLPTLAGAVLGYINNPFVFRSITRLDRDTSGIVLIAKDMLSAAKLSRSMRDGHFKKEYLARVVGIPSPEEGEIDAPIARESEGAMRRVIREDGKPSRTRYKVISSDEQGNALVSLTLLTGRTHQIRVHMAHIGHPLFNDFLYGERVYEGTYSLHCRFLSFPHPLTGQTIEIKCENNDI